MTFIIQCPHCELSIEVIELNCRIFRCGIHKTTFKQIDPHLPKIECDRLTTSETIFGCGKPFQLIQQNGLWVPVICDYI